MKTFKYNTCNSAYRRTSTPPKPTITYIQKQASFFFLRSVRVLESLRPGFKRPKLATKQILIGFTRTSSASFLTQETLNLGTYPSKFPFRNLGWSLHVFFTQTFQVQARFQRENISEYSVVTQALPNLAL